MAGSIYLHTGEEGRVEWDRLADNSGLGARVFESSNRHSTDVGIFCRPDVLADLLIELTTWDDVIDAVSRKIAPNGFDGEPLEAVGDLPAVAVAYFRRGFEIFGEQTAHYACKVADNA